MVVWSKRVIISHLQVHSLSYTVWRSELCFHKATRLKDSTYSVKPLFESIFPLHLWVVSGKEPNLFIHLTGIYKSATLCQELIQVVVRYAQIIDLFGHQQAEAFHGLKMCQVFLWRSTRNIHLMKLRFGQPSRKNKNDTLVS